MSDANNTKKFDVYGFPVDVSQRSQPNPMTQGLKIFAWTMLAFFILIYMFTGGIAGYLSYYDFKDTQNAFLRWTKIFLAVILNWLYLGIRSVRQWTGKG